MTHLWATARDHNVVAVVSSLKTTLVDCQARGSGASEGRLWHPREVGNTVFSQSQRPTPCEKERRSQNVSGLVKGPGNSTRTVQRGGDHDTVYRKKSVFSIS